MVHPLPPRRVSNFGLVALCWVAGVLLGVASVFVLSWGDSYERTDSLIGMAVMGTVVGLVVGAVAVLVRAAVRNRREV